MCSVLNSSIWIVDNNQREIYWLTVGSNKRFLIITGFFPFRFTGIATAVGPPLCAILQNQLIWNISTSTNKLVFDYIVSYSDKKFSCNIILLVVELEAGKKINFKSFFFFFF